jgi:tetratricopeptide (TPR) repeat protein
MPGAIARIEHKLGNLYQRIGHWTTADSHFRAAESLLSEPDASANQTDLARLIADRSLMAHRRGEAERAWRLGERALDLASNAGDERALAQSHNLLGMLVRGLDEVAAREHLEESLRLTCNANSYDIRASTLNNLALLEHLAGNHPRAIELGQEALDLATMQGDRHRRAAIHSNLADFHHATGDANSALQHLRESAAIYADIGVVAGEREAEIWKLAEW